MGGCPAFNCDFKKKLQNCTILTCSIFDLQVTSDFTSDEIGLA